MTVAEVLKTLSIGMCLSPDKLAECATCKRKQEAMSAVRALAELAAVALHEEVPPLDPVVELVRVTEEVGGYDKRSGQ